jgi:hypothetical protein
MSHLALPQKTMTKENLAKWLTENTEEKKLHEEKVDYTAQEIIAFEHQSSLASRAIDRLTEIAEKFKKAMNEGVMIPETFTVPETKGLKILKENRAFADGEIEKGYRIIPTQLYGVPYAATSKVVFFDIEGNHFEQHDYKFNPFQEEKYGTPLFKDEENLLD